MTELRRARNRKEDRHNLFRFWTPASYQIDEFIVSEIKTEFDLHPDQKSVLSELIDIQHLLIKMKSTWEIITGEGRRTIFRADAYMSGIFTGPNIDYEVLFREV